MLKRALIAGVIASTWTLSAAQSPPGDATVGRQRATVEEIVVQARKRAERLEDTPVSVTAVGLREMQEAGITQIDQIEQLVPNLVFTQSFTGVDAGITIRGVGTSAVDGIFDPGVGVYLDGVFLPRTGFQLFDIVDLEQVEVLRGPQGTLFGKNTIGGALNLTTVKPHEELEGRLLVRPGNFDSVETRATVNVPLTDRLFSRFSFGSRNTAGYEQNEFRDQEYGDTTFLSVVGAVRAVPIDEVTIDLVGTYSRRHGHGPGPQCAVEAEGGLGNLVPGFYDQCRASRPYEFGADALGLQSIENSVFWGLVTADLGDIGPFEDLQTKWIGSWGRSKTWNRIDLDGTESAVLSFAANGGGPQQGRPFVQDATQAEAQLSGTGFDGRLKFVSGIFALWEKQTARTALGIVPSVLNTLTAQQQNFDNWNWAIYTQATVEPTSWLSLTAGIRYTEEKKGAFTNTVDLNIPGAIPDEASNSAIFTKWTPMASVALTAPGDLLDLAPGLDHAMAYFTFSRGFKGGGFNLATGAAEANLDEFQPETLDSYEVGLKTIAFDQRVTFNASFFLGRYDEIQVTTIRVIDANSTDPSNFVRQTLNAAKATTKGFELELTALPIPGLQIRGVLGLTDTEYREFMGPSSLDDSIVDRSGQTFNGIPRLQSNVSVQYAIPVSFGGPEWLDGYVTPRLEWNQQSKVHWDFVELETAKQRGYHTLNGRLSYAFNDDQTEIALWARNITDEVYFNAVQSLANVTGTITRYHAPPVTFGAEIHHRF